MLEVKDLHAYYGRSHILAGRKFEGRQRRNRQFAGPQRRRSIDCLQNDNGARAAPRVRSFIRAKRSPDCKPHTIAHKGIGFVPEDRWIFPGSDRAAKSSAGFERQKTAGTLDHRGRVRNVSETGRAIQRPGRLDFRRRTADADHLPHTDGRSRLYHD